MVPVRDECLCMYNGGSCPNQRAMHRHGRRMLRFCDYHNRRAGCHQARYLQRHQRPQRPPSPRHAEPIALPVPAAATPSPIVVVVIVGDTTALQRLSSDASNPLSSFLRHLTGGTSEVTMVGGSQSALTARVMTAPGQAQSEATAGMDLEPLSLQTTVSPDDVDWLNSVPL